MFLNSSYLLQISTTYNLSFS